ncbi:alpha/beta hydrolase [Klebsiella variicola]|nr:alpha/beta hydrolase [Klebsiella variicola]
MKTSTHKLSNGIALTLNVPENTTQNPTIILCHGFCGIREILLPDFAKAFTSAGFTTITFDYRGFGDSDGERGRLVPAMQVDDIISVINWAKEQPEIDSQRIGLWGTSLGGGHVINAAVRDMDIKCIVSQLAFSDGEKVITRDMNETDKAAFLSSLNKIAQKQNNTGKEMMVGVTRVLSDAESKMFFEKNREKFPKMDIKIPFLTVKEMLQYKPGMNASHLSCPTLIVIAGKDIVNPPEEGRSLFDAIGSKVKRLYEVKNSCHYDIYFGEKFKEVIKIQTEWFKTHL